jgi:hypothetical protein
LPGGLEIGERPVDGLELVVTSGGTVTGRIFGLGPERLHELEVWAARHGMPGRAGVVEWNGSYRIEGLAPGEWTVTARSPSLGREARGHTVVDADGAAAILDLEFLAGFTLSGAIARDGRPVGGVVVVGRSPTGAAGGAVTDGAGRFRIEGLAAGSYLLTLVDRSTGSQALRQVTLDGDLDIEIDLSESAPAVEGLVERGHGDTP